MSKKQIKRIIFMGLGCAVLLIAAVIYSLLYNEGRWVKEMDMSTYVFSPKDIPMLAVGVLIAVYAVYILVLCVRNALSKKYPDKKYSRTISPLWGFCGIFGFFGLFFEGKLSHTLEDELFQENRRKAQLKAYKTGFRLLFIVIWLMGLGMFSRNVEWCAIFMLISVSFIYALVLFLSNYFLYRYEKGE